MNYEKAKKEVQTKKKSENYLLVKLEYDTQLVLPHKAGVAFIEAMSHAEKLHTPYNAPHRIQELDRGKFEITTLAAEDYDRYKIAALLNVTIDEVKAYEKGEPSPLAQTE